jgi:hypothetical protein
MATKTQRKRKLEQRRAHAAGVDYRDKTLNFKRYDGLDDVPDGTPRRPGEIIKPGHRITTPSGKVIDVEAVETPFVDTVKEAGL